MSKSSADYRRMANETRKIARHISIRDAREKLLEAAAHLDAIADELEAHAARRKPSGPSVSRFDT